MVKQLNRRSRIKTAMRILFLLGALLICVAVKSQTLTVTGSAWTPIIVPITEAGSDYPSYESPSGQIKLGLTVPLLLGTGKVTVKYISNGSTTWHNSLKIDVRKLDNGSGFGVCVGCSMSPSGATPYQEVLTTDVELLRATAVLSVASVNDISLKVRVRPSVIAPVDNYSASIVFTIGSP